VIQKPAYRFLEEFDCENESIVVPIVHQLAQRRGPSRKSAVTDSKQTGEFYAKGYAEGRDFTRNQIEMEIAAAVLDCERRIAENKASFSETIATVIASELRRRLDEMHSTIEGQIVTALIPVLSHVMTEASIREVAAGLRLLARDGEAVSIVVSGPEELIECVWRCYRDLEPDKEGDAKPIVSFEVGATTEVRASVNNTVIESRLMEWIANIRKAAS